MNSPYRGRDRGDTRRPDWRDDAACRGMDTRNWFPEEAGAIGNSATARRVCRGCPVNAACLEFALDNGEAWGIWGGLSARQRHDLRRRRLAVPVDWDGHGTESGYVKHLRLNSVPCAECRRAHAKFVAAKRERLRQRRENV